MHKKIYLISNIIFYVDSKTNEKKAMIFYKDGSMDYVSYEDGINASVLLAMSMDIDSIDSFKKMIYNDKIMVVSESVIESFKKTFASKHSNDTDSGASDSSVDTNKTTPIELSSTLNSDSIDSSSEPSSKNDDDSADILEFSDVQDALEVDDDDTDEQELFNKMNSRDDDFDAIEEIFNGKNKTNDFKNNNDSGEVEEKNNTFKSTPDKKDDLVQIKEEKDVDKNKNLTPTTSILSDLDKSGTESNDGVDDYILTSGDECSTKKDSNKKKDRGIRGFFKRAFNKIKKHPAVASAVVCLTALLAGFGLYSCNSKKSLTGEISNSNLSSISSKNDPKTSNDDVLLIGDNQYYEDFSFDKLISVTNNNNVSSLMTNLNTSLKGFNLNFANYYVEDGKKIKPSLKFDEVVALQNAYNDISKDDLKAYFNGADVNANDLTRAYKDASLQLMGAYVIETKQHPLDMSMLINSKEGKDFYNKYHKLFMDCKYASGDEQIRLVEEFYKNVKADFPITRDVRTEGISHSDNYDKIESYKLSVTPIIAAAEMMFQNLKVDNTLNNGDIHFLNDIGLCNYAEEKFKRIETICLTSDEIVSEPLYDQFKKAIVSALVKDNAYFIDDAHRELSKLDTFQLAVNGHFDQIITGNFKCTTTSTVVSSSNTTYSESTTTKELPIPDSEKSKIDSQIAAENAKSKSAGESAAESNRQSMQAAEDKNASKIREDVKRDEQDFQNKISSANEKIDSGNTVNEDDFGDHGVEFDENHSNSNGDLDSSVKNITTDSSSDKTNNPLPDPNVTGREFDKKGNSSVGISESQSFNEDQVDSDTDDDYYDEDFWEEEIPANNELADDYVSNEELVDNYVESLANADNSNDVGYQYTK